MSGNADDNQAPAEASGDDGNEVEGHGRVFIAEPAGEGDDDEVKGHRWVSEDEAEGHGLRR